MDVTLLNLISILIIKLISNILEKEISYLDLIIRKMINKTIFRVI